MIPEKQDFWCHWIFWRFYTSCWNLHSKSKTLCQHYHVPWFRIFDQFHQLVFHFQRQAIYLWKYSSQDLNSLHQRTVELETIDRVRWLDKYRVVLARICTFLTLCSLMRSPQATICTLTAVLPLCEIPGS